MRRVRRALAVAVEVERFVPGEEMERMESWMFVAWIFLEKVGEGGIRGVGDMMGGRQDYCMKQRKRYMREQNPERSGKASQKERRILTCCLTASCSYSFTPKRKEKKGVKKKASENTHIHIRQMRFRAPLRYPRHTIRIFESILQQRFPVHFGYEMGVDVDFAVCHFLMSLSKINLHIRSKRRQFLQG